MIDRAPKLMFVLSHDYGELFRATYLLAGYEFQSVFLMPERLLAVNRGGLPGPALAYRSFVDVFEAVDVERPDVVFLFSGYLYTINNLFHVDTVQALVRKLRERECRLVTSDPFQGILADVDDSTFSDAHPRKAWLTWLFIHIYYLIGFKNRFFVFYQWAWAYLTFRRGARLIQES